MVVNIDQAGRVVIPKEIRERLDVGPETGLDIEIDGGSIRLTPRLPARRRIVEVDGRLRIESTGGVLTDADVQRWRDADQR